MFVEYDFVRLRKSIHTNLCLSIDVLWLAALISLVLVGTLNRIKCVQDVDHKV